MSRNRLIASVAIACVAYVACVTQAFAAPVLVSWDLPTQWDNGAALNPATDLEAVRVFVDGVEAARVPGTASSAELDLRAGTYQITASVVSTEASIGEGSESSVSAAITHAVVAPRPRPPTLLQVVIAWLRSVWGRFA